VAQGDDRRGGLQDHSNGLFCRIAHQRTRIDIGVETDVPQEFGGGLNRAGSIGHYLPPV
jgi:hypothetical protein